MAFVGVGSALKRKKWVQEGLVQAKSKSFWSQYTGGSKDSAVVVQANMETAEAGHTITFDYDGNLAGSAVKGDDTAYGKGEEKKKFSASLTVDRYRLVVNNGNKFDAKDIGDLSLAEHGDSRDKLADLFMRWKDQFIFDTAQGLLGQTPSHIIDTTATLDYNTLLDIETKVKTSSGFTTGSARRPLVPYRLSNGEGVWLFIVDTFMARKIKMSAGYQAMVYQADVRGSDNRALKGIIGKIGSLLIVEADVFFGATNATAVGFGMEKTTVEMSGLRRKDANGKWTGMTGYTSAGQQISRGLIFGAGALQMGMGMMPDYKVQPSPDFGITSESCLEVWTGMQKTRLLAETDDYAQAKISGMDWGVIAIDVETQPA